MIDKPIRFSQHADTKFEVLRAHGLGLEQGTVLATVNHPDEILNDYSGRKVAQALLDERRVLRVVYEERSDEILIITFYPGKRERYEKSKIQ